MYSFFCHSFLLLLLLGAALHVHAADGPYESAVMAAVKRSDPWLLSPNGAALTRYAMGNVAEAGLSLAKGRGGFTDFSGSPDVLTFDATVESYFRLNRRTVVSGAMSYTNFSGRDMAGSAFALLPSRLSTGIADGAYAAPQHLPFDIVEDSLTNTGTKHQDTYRLMGALGYDLCNGLSLGARIDYLASNVAKYKDLRHKNKLMDLDLTAGFHLPLAFGGEGGGFHGAVGAHYLYHRTTESLLFSTYGKNDKVYNSLVSYANFMGHVEQFGSDGYTDKSREMPLVSDYNGVGVQLSLSKPRSSRLSLQLYSAFTYAHCRGYYGRRSPYTITYTGHASDVYRYDAQLSALTPRASRLTLDLSLSAENLRNDASNYRTLQNEQGATYYDYYTPVKTANKLWVDGQATLTADLGRVILAGADSCAVAHIPAWTLRLGLNWHRREQTAYAYPYVRRQDLSSREPFVSISRNIGAAGGAYWSLSLHFSFLKGSGAPSQDFTLQPPSDKQEPPATTDAWLWREYLWLTAPQYRVGGSVAYSFVVPAIRLRTFVRLTAGHHKANKTSEYSVGSDHTTASLAIGCCF